MIAAAVAVGAASGLGDTAKKVVADAYSALKGLIGRRYTVIDAEVLGVESEPEEPLRRQLLAKKLGQAGAGDDAELQAAAENLLRVAADEAPEAAQTVGIRVSEVRADGGIEIADLTANDGGGVQVSHLTAGESISLRGFTASRPADPPTAPR